MSRIANAPLAIPEGVQLQIEGSLVTAKGRQGSLSQVLPPQVSLSREGALLHTRARDGSRRARAMAGTCRVLLQNLLTGVSVGFERRLEVMGVGYRVQVQGRVLNLQLGFSHPVNFQVPEGITVETPSQTEIVVRGADKQQVGQVAADIRSRRPPEPYKGKGVRYVDERVVRKEAKKS